MSLAYKLKKNLAIRLASLQNRALTGFRQSEIETIARHVAEQVGRGVPPPLIAFARALAEKATAIPNKFAENGERSLLDRMASLPVRTMFDVGANVGTWSSHALKVFPHAELHAFEIVPTTFNELRLHLPDAANVHLNQIGLSDAAGATTVYLYDSNLISSMFALEADGDSTGTITCTVQSGAEYAAAHGIRDIDLLKIDVEGAEGKVLKGFEPMIADRRVRLIQFEYNRGAILGDFLLKHAYAFFTPYGYQLGKLGPDGVYFHQYHFADEDFLGPNYIACQSADSELIGLISVNALPRRGKG